MKSNYFIILLLCVYVNARNNSLDPFRTLNDPKGSKLLTELHRKTVNPNSSDLNFCVYSVIPESNLCDMGSLIWQDSADGILNIQPIFSLEYLLLNNEEKQTDYGIARESEGVSVFRHSFGLRSMAKKDFASLWMEARIYSEYQESYVGSIDGQYIERQEEGNNSALSYISYSRFIGGVNLKSSIGDFGISRNNIHWGPSYFYPLLLGKYTPPINHIYYSISLGNLKVNSIYGSADIGSQGRFTGSKFDKTLIGHRFQYDFKYLTIGINELLILFDLEEPLAFLPAIPLFMYKGQTREPDNNGNISFDITGRINSLRIYGEFLIDDLSEPSKLFNDYWKNRWALTVGFHYAKDIEKGALGSILEFSRVEPWVYTHYIKNTAQSSHFDFPIANPNGPNSLSIGHKLYFQSTIGLGFELDQTWVWKGKDNGSSLNDIHEDSDGENKSFLKLQDPMSYLLSPTLRFHQKYWAIESQVQLEWIKGSLKYPELKLVTTMYY